jgi:hypothetical protein
MSVVSSPDRQSAYDIYRFEEIVVLTPSAISGSSISKACCFLALTLEYGLVEEHYGRVPLI